MCLFIYQLVVKYPCHILRPTALPGYRQDLESLSIMDRVGPVCSLYIVPKPMTFSSGSTAKKKLGRAYLWIVHALEILM